MNQVTPELERQERELEGEAIGLGQERYWKELEKRGPENMKPGLALMRRMILPLAEEIRQWVEAAQAGKVAPRSVSLPQFLGQLEPYDVAFITARHVVATWSEEDESRRKLTSVAMSLTRWLEDAVTSDKLPQEDLNAWKRLAAKAARRQDPKTRCILIRKAMGKAQSIQRIKWDENARARLGLHLIHLCAETSSGTFKITKRREKGKSVKYIETLQATLDELHKAHERCALNSPRYLPMVVPPKPWTTLEDGGYLDTGLHPRLIRSKYLDKDYLDSLKDADMPMVYEAVNAVQATPWRINKDVHRVLKEAKARGEADLPEDIQTKLYIADKFAEFDAFYFPQYLDFRGRMYPIPQHVNPQAADTGRALLEFTRGVELGEDGAYHLAVHGANTFGFDKKSHDERVDWVKRNRQVIRAAACDPFENRFWTKAHDPFMFLAFCFEWKKLQDWVGPDGALEKFVVREWIDPVRAAAVEKFVSHLPVSGDGSCNGLQHFSALLRDPIGGAATNLVPSESDKPADTYQLVADEAAKRVERGAAVGNVNAVAWKGKVTRDVAKQPTMTLPYGASHVGRRDQLRAWLKKYKLKNGTPYIDGDEFRCCTYLAKVLYDAIKEVVEAAPTAMDWLKDAARLVAAGGKPVRWTTPVGFIVQQEYHKKAPQQVDFIVFGHRYQARLQIDTDGIDKRRQTQGISPNFIHSLDAAHLVGTVCLCKEAGVDDFAMVHDSYGTHAGKARLLHHKLRRAFVEQYGTVNLLETLRDELLQQVPEKDRAKMPPVPPLGNLAWGELDLTEVQGSDFFFA